MKATLRSYTLLLSFFFALATLSSCDDDEKPKTVPIVATAEITDITTTSAKGGGEITSDGNSEVTVVGLVYSSAIAEPTLVDSKTETTLTDDSFTSLMESLSSGTVYHVRAYATNSIGTGYGEVVEFTTGNAAPVATAVTITGTLEANKQVTGTYTYTDAESNAESGTTFQWYAANDATGAGETAITGATSITYLIAPAYEGKYLSFGVTPKAAAGTTSGVEVRSNRMGGVGEATTVTFVYNGATVTYGIIASSKTNRKWMDRNLGAPNVPTAFDNYQNYGDLFQWGRDDDGHQVVTRSGDSDAEVVGVNGTTTTRSTSDSPGHSKFIIVPDDPSDWTNNPPYRNFWQGVSGTNNPCPEGWRIPTIEEWEAEEIDNLLEGYSQLKLTLTGSRSGVSGDFELINIFSTYWASTIPPPSQTTSSVYVMEMILTDNPPAYQFAPRTQGYPCRCLKN